MATPKKLRRLALNESITLAILAARIREKTDPTLADLIDQVAAGDDSAMVPAVDRLIELGREELAARLKALVGG
jgi:hypothetical protein